MSNLIASLKTRLRLPLRWLNGAEVIEKTDSLQHLTDARPKFVPRAVKEGEYPIQVSAEGVGALFHRLYAVDIAEPTVSAETLMAQIKTSINHFSPSTLASFERLSGNPETLAIGDEFHIHIAGPWDGRVSVINVQALSFTFITLDGHLEAGEITFRIDPTSHKSDYYRFEIISWARSRDWIVNFAYDTLGIAKVAQTGTWVIFCQRVAEASGGALFGNVEVRTEKVNFSDEVIPNE